MIASTLEQGWDYQPDWRNKVVELYMVEKALIENPLMRWGMRRLDGIVGHVPR